MPYTKVILGPAYSVRLVDLQASDCVFARCMYCRKVWRIATHRLYDRFPPHESLRLIGSRMKCTKCGTGAGMSWHVLRASWESR